jgi:hypothetical protein
MVVSAFFLHIDSHHCNPHDFPLSVDVYVLLQNPGGYYFLAAEIYLQSHPGEFPKGFRGAEFSAVSEKFERRGVFRSVPVSAHRPARGLFHCPVQTEAAPYADSGSPAYAGDFLSHALVHRIFPD